MTSPNPMTRDELLESAALDAFGLLDEYDAALYTRSFYNAPAAVQSEIVQLQAKLVSDESLMSLENPDPTLRQRVLDAVADAIQSETVQLAPLATIGRPRGVEAVTPRFAFGTPSQFWRAAAFVLCTGLIVLAFFFSDARKWGNEVATLALMNNTDAQLEKMIGPTFKDYAFAPTSKKVSLLATANGDPSMRAVVFTIEGSDEAFLLIEGLPVSNSQTQYTLTLKNSAGETQTATTFASNGRLSGVKVALNVVASQLKDARWEITDAGNVLLLASV